MTNSLRFRSLMKRFKGDETGAVAVEYVIMFTFLIVAFIWLNKSMDTLLFGASPYSRTGNPTATEALDPELQANAIHRMQQIAGNAQSSTTARPDRAYLAQIYIHLSRP